ncbi:hypothetical protein [Wenzhouxiangella marina]|uniref:Uncharacterized protein n=1 Tax=Wenzhouxiangella marina TaxID=1579979 RepID=A0A0K0XS44_9GAMM|nr:hypothetical protein [Wenzhouxiangella marina]AKS40446.1 hypothetical protein WM2015_55 [Wenzhouxiangella marina]MBB6088232.1 hypothetical protein [Wenzhouxiangella marina]
MPANPTLRLVLILGMLSLIIGLASESHAVDCASAVPTDAEALLRFHRGDDERIYIEEDVNSLGPHPNPAASDEAFQHYEVWGHIYKGRYRMRFQYAELPDDCLLMGQEIMEFAVLGYTMDRTDSAHGVIRSLTMGDRACYLQLETRDGQTVDYLADFEMCERGALIGETVQLILEPARVAAASCEGDPECPDSERVELVVDAILE